MRSKADETYDLILQTTSNRVTFPHVGVSFQLNLKISIYTIFIKPFPKTEIL